MVGIDARKDSREPGLARRSPGGSARTRVLGIDPGTLRTGYGIIDVGVGGAIHYVACGVLEAKGDSHVGRINLICGDLKELVEEFSPAAMAIELAYAGRNPASALKLAEARGAFRQTAFNAGLNVVEYGSNHVKRALTGRARARKEEVMDRMARLFSLTSTPREDAADALALAMCHATHLRGAATPASAVGRLP
jgi:crossover junction endodeoxyribonuclease RuvC